MRVDFTSLGAEAPENNKTNRAGSSGGSGAAASQSASGTTDSATGIDQARFSFDQTRVQSLADHVLAQPDIRETKIRSLQQAIGNGEYSVPPSQVADALVAELSTGTHG
jgi:flagellar biosynthesis anti-sigma factor FlgM